MIVVDTSAIIAIFRREPDAPVIAGKLENADVAVIAAAGVLEASIVLRSLKGLFPAEAERWLDEFIIEADLKVIPMTIDHVRAARAAHLLFGKGTGHPARLNFGDCCTYALAKVFGAPLLFKGDDFSKTDLIAV
ncbi:type II toxin-antitoxin system VapC family toxin [Azospirillum sp. sgz301742]